MTNKQKRMTNKQKRMTNKQKTIWNQKRSDHNLTLILESPWKMLSSRWSIWLLDRSSTSRSMYTMLSGVIFLIWLLAMYSSFNHGFSMIGRTLNWEFVQITRSDSQTHLAGQGMNAFEWPVKPINTINEINKYIFGWGE